MVVYVCVCRHAELDFHFLRRNLAIKFQTIECRRVFDKSASSWPQKVRRAKWYMRRKSVIHLNAKQFLHPKYPNWKHDRWQSVFGSCIQLYFRRDFLEKLHSCSRINFHNKNSNTLATTNMSLSIVSNCNRLG